MFKHARSFAPVAETWRAGLEAELHTLGFTVKAGANGSLMLLKDNNRAQLWLYGKQRAKLAADHNLSLSDLQALRSLHSCHLKENT